MPTRFDAWKEAISEWDEKAIKGVVEFDKHRFIAIERAKTGDDRYATGHKTLRGACNHLSRALEEGETFIPEYIIDLDTGERHELDVFAAVVPKSVAAVSLVLPPGTVSAILSALDASSAEACAQAAKMVRTQQSRPRN